MIFRRKDDRPSEFELVSQRIEVIDGILAALRNPELLLSTCQAAASQEEALDAVRVSFGVSTRQALFMLDMRFAQHTALGRQSIEAERLALQRELERCRPEQSDPPNQHGATGSD